MRAVPRRRRIARLLRAGRLSIEPACPRCCSPACTRGRCGRDRQSRCAQGASSVRRSIACNVAPRAASSSGTGEPPRAAGGRPQVRARGRRPPSGRPHGRSVGFWAPPPARVRWCELRCVLWRAAGTQLRRASPLYLQTSSCDFLRMYASHGACGGVHALSPRKRANESVLCESGVAF